MKAVKFTLKGKTAFFKNPEVNSYFYFTYGNIHKPALLGMFGAILGYKGYESSFEVYPEYYDKLKELKVAIIPHQEHGCFARKVQVFNNSVGYASQEQGGNLIVKEQWLENPSWMIYVLIDDDESQKLSEYLLERKAVYIPYLGKNDHPAIIENVGVVDLQMNNSKNIRIDSLVKADDFQFDFFHIQFKYEEYLPISLKESTNHYELAKMIFTDATMIESQKEVYNDGEKNIIFY